MSEPEKNQQWRCLHQQFHDYERCSLLLKITSAVAAFWLVQHTWQLALMLVIMLWGLDSIWKTFQSRIHDHLLALEQNQVESCQLYSQFQRSRPSALGLLAGYLGTALRPTVALPHLLLALLIGLSTLIH